MLVVDEAIQDAIRHSDNGAMVRDAARQAGMNTLWEDAIEKVRHCVTSPDEIAKVLGANRDGL